MKYKVTLNQKVYEVEVEQGEAILVDVADIAVAAPVAAAPAAAAPAAAPAPAAPVAPGSGEVVPAPLPGNVVAIKVNPGDSVKQGQPLLLIEAMKMENEILSPRDGVIGQILVTKGTLVTTGTPMITLV